jgi:hypothetical protein
MGYYQGDFYAGARGDPGIGSFFSGLLGKGISAVKGLFKGGGSSSPISSIIKTGGAATAGRIIKAGKGIIMKHPVLSAAGAAGAGGLLAGSGAVALSHRGAGAAHVPGMRRRRRMNVCNPRALRRSIRRTHGFAKLAMRTIHLVHPKKKVKFGGFRKKKSHK